ncbi:interleukin-13 receptor subunit alpha-1-like [Aulostomus maculatus]
MSSTRDLLTFLMSASVIAGSSRQPGSWDPLPPGRLPPPTNLIYKCPDAFTINVSWTRPSSLPDHCEVAYEYRLDRDTPGNSWTRTIWRNFTDYYLTDELASSLRYVVHTVGINHCEGSSSEPVIVSVNVMDLEPATLVKDFNCFLGVDYMNCSWIPLAPNLTLSYRSCGRSKELRDTVCKQPYTSGSRSGCHLSGVMTDLCILVRTEGEKSTFRPSLVINSPKLSIEEGNNLMLRWTPPEVGQQCTWIYELCYKNCVEEKCLNHTTNKADVPYDTSCQYKFWSRAMTGSDCPLIHSNFSGALIYPETVEPADWSLTVVAVVIPIILSISVILSCYCFRRHSAIICPVIPDPSAIFKGMMHGGRELKTPSEAFYILDPEPVETFEITPAAENLQQNS